MTTKMKGAFQFNDTSNFVGCEDYFNDSSFVVYDPADYVIPPQVCVCVCVCVVHSIYKLIHDMYYILYWL